MGFRRSQVDKMEKAAQEFSAVNHDPKSSHEDRVRAHSTWTRAKGNASEAELAAYHRGEGKRR